MNKTFTLFLLAIFIIGIQCDETNKLQRIQYLLTQFSSKYAVKTFPKLEMTPILLHIKTMIHAIITIPFVTDLQSQVTIYINFKQSGQSCNFKPKGHKSNIVSYQAVLEGNGKIVFSIQTIKLPDNKYQWEILVLDPYKCNIRHKSIEAINDFSSEFIRWMTLVPKTLSFRIIAEVSSSMDSQTSKLAVIKFTNSNKVDKIKSKSRKSLEYLDLRPVENEKILLDQSNQQYYIIEKTNLSSTKIWPVQKLNSSLKLGYEYQYDDDLTNAYKAISTDNGHVTFCYSDSVTRKSITCTMFESKTGIAFSAGELSTKKNVVAVLIKNIDEKNTLLIWIESSDDHKYDVMAEIIADREMWGEQKLFQTEKIIEFINFYRDDDVNCLYIGQIGVSDADVISYCL